VIRPRRLLRGSAVSCTVRRRAGTPPPQACRRQPSRTRSRWPERRPGHSASQRLGRYRSDRRLRRAGDAPRAGTAALGGVVGPSRGRGRGAGPGCPAWL